MFFFFFFAKKVKKEFFHNVNRDVSSFSPFLLTYITTTLKGSLFFLPEFQMSYKSCLTQLFITCFNLSCFSFFSFFYDILLSGYWTTKETASAYSASSSLSSLIDFFKKILPLNYYRNSTLRKHSKCL